MLSNRSVMRCSRFVASCSQNVHASVEKDYDGISVPFPGCKMQRFLESFLIFSHIVSASIVYFSSSSSALQFCCDNSGCQRASDSGPAVDEAKRSARACRSWSTASSFPNGTAYSNSVSLFVVSNVDIMRVLELPS